jgi:hypothetical protein
MVRPAIAYPAAAAVLLACAAAAFELGARLPRGPAPTVSARPTPNVVLAVRDLSRLEAASYHMEKVVELTDRQSRFFGLVEAKDALLLVAVGDVVAGVDLSKVGDGDVQLDATVNGVRVRLPRPEVLSASIDEAQTRVYERTTDVMASRNEQLEGLARQEAERAIRQGALDGGILDRARASAERTVRTLLLSLGFARVEITWGGE